ncbi:ABC transporter B member 19, partial [Sarracenia purpurea var. burkii]
IYFVTHRFWPSGWRSFAALFAVSLRVGDWVCIAKMADTMEAAKAMPEADKKKEQSLPFYQLFSFADKFDWLLMISGSLGAVVHGSSMPVFFLLFGEMVNGFGKNQSDLKAMTHEVSKVRKSIFMCNM